jgi:hypothetical protein
MDFTPDVLRNKGVPIRLAQVRKDENDWVPLYTSDGDMETETHYLKFNHNVIADMEEQWDGIQNWQDAMAEKPISTLRRTIAICLLIPVERVGGMLIEGRLPEYSNAIGTAWALANGVDPTVASQLLNQAEMTVDSQIKMLNSQLGDAVQEMAEATDTMNTLGKKPSQPGAKQTKGTQTSGKQAQVKS